MSKLLAILLSLLSVVCYAQDTNELKKRIETILADRSASIGVAVIHKGDTIVVNNTAYPTLSVFKFHQALAVLHYLDTNKRSLDEKLFVRKADLLPNMYSPLRDEQPEGNFEITIKDLLKYTVSKSDNNTCDILFRFVGGTEYVDNYIKGLGLANTSIAATEEDMHKEWGNQYLNTSSPLDAVKLLELFYSKQIKMPLAYQEFLWQIMVETSTGPNKIKGLLPAGTIVGHKTGSSFRNEDKLKAAENDIGIVILPDGTHYSIAIFVSNSKEDDVTNERITAEISKAVWDFYTLMN